MKADVCALLYGSYPTRKQKILYWRASNHQRVWSSESARFGIEIDLYWVSTRKRRHMWRHLRSSLSVCVLFIRLQVLQPLDRKGNSHNSCHHKRSCSWVLQARSPGVQQVRGQGMSAAVSTRQCKEGSSIFKRLCARTGHQCAEFRLTWEEDPSKREHIQKSFKAVKHSAVSKEEAQCNIVAKLDAAEEDKERCQPWRITLTSKIELTCTVLLELSPARLCISRIGQSVNIGRSCYMGEEVL